MQQIHIVLLSNIHNNALEYTDVISYISIKGMLKPLLK